MNPDRPRPGRAELFGFYYLGFDPEGRYRFPNVRHVAAFYGVGHEAVETWLAEAGLSPREVLFSKYELARVQVDLQLERPNLTDEGLRERIEGILKEFDRSESGRRPWEDDGKPW